MSHPYQLLNTLKDIGYLSLRLPRADVMPLHLLHVDGSEPHAGHGSEKPRGTGRAAPRLVKTTDRFVEIV